MQIKKLEIFNNIILLSNKKIHKDVLRLNNSELMLSYLRQNTFLMEEVKKDGRWFKSRILICVSDPYLTELAILIKKELFEIQNEKYEINVIESKDFYMEVPRDVKLVIFIGKIEAKMATYCLANEILLLNVISIKFSNRNGVYYLPFQIDNLSALIWILLFYKNI